MFRDQFGPVYDIAWSTQHQLAFMCYLLSYILVLDLSTGRFLGRFRQTA